MKIDFEYFMMEKHAEQYIGAKELMIDDFNEWITDVSPEDWCKYANEFAQEVLIANVLKKGEEND